MLAYSITSYCSVLLLGWLWCRERPFTDTCELNIDEYVELFKRSSTHKKSSFNRIYNCIISFK